MDTLFATVESGKKRGELGMRRLIYWIRKCVKGKNRYCRCFCVTCEHYESCKRDGGMG